MEFHPLSVGEIGTSMNSTFLCIHVFIFLYIHCEHLCARHSCFEIEPTIIGTSHELEGAD